MASQQDMSVHCATVDEEQKGYLLNVVKGGLLELSIQGETPTSDNLFKMLMRDEELRSQYSTVMLAYPQSTLMRSACATKKNL